jgi:hypothetical protein
MSRPPDYLNPPAIKISAQRLACWDCGSETNATCTCGVAYLPKAAERVAEYDKANPGQSTRQAAADLGISNKTVSQARQQAPVTEVTPATVTGRDGKTYPAGMTPGHINNFRRNLPTPRVADTPEMEAKDAAADDAITDIVQRFQRLPSSRQQDRCMRQLMAGYKR